MADSYIQVAPDSTGKKMQTYLNTIAGTDVHGEAVVLVDQFGVPLSSIGGGLTNAELRASPVPVSEADGANVTIGAIADAAISTDANGTVNAHIRGIVKLLVAKINVKIADGEDVTQGVTTGAAVVTDANGTLQQYLRGLVKLWAAGPPLTDARFDATRNVLPIAGQKLAVSTYSPSLFQNLGANATLNVKSSAGNIFSFSCYNANAAVRYIQLHNTATVPAGSAVPIFSFLVPPSGQIIIGTDFFTNEGVNFATGIAFAFSTARDIYTAGSAGDQSTWIQYK